MGGVRPEGPKREESSCHRASYLSVQVRVLNNELKAANCDLRRGSQASEEGWSGRGSGGPEPRWPLLGLSASL